ncbi:MAG: class I SAM-dependent methyltransferase [Desulfamplus sp.]|nr:class I SAM-dependent methyltransferase [Desulfamplus sp.]
MNPCPSEKALNVVYRDIYSTSEYRKIDGYANQRFEDDLAAGLLVFESVIDEIESFRTSPGSLLDVGCGIGGHLFEASTRGWKTVGVEPSLAMTSFSQKQLGLQVHNCTIENMEVAQESFDAVLMLEVIEHMSKPLNILRRIHRLAKPGGVLYITCPNAHSPCACLLGPKWMGWKPPTHLFFFHFLSIRKSLELTGWDPLLVKSGGRYPGQLKVIAKKINS